MTVVWAWTWLGQSAALAALTAAFVRLPGFRGSAAAGLLRLPPVFTVAGPPDAEFRVPAQADPAKMYVPQRLNR
jgi:hypothetical protein